MDCGDLLQAGLPANPSLNFSFRSASVGDKLLIAVADRLRSNLRSTDLLSRMGGDEFLLMSSGFKLASQAQELGAQLVKSIAEPFTVSQHHCQIGLTVGYAIASNNANDTRLLLIRADAAMYAGKQSGKNCTRHAEPADNLL